MSRLRGVMRVVVASEQDALARALRDDGVEVVLIGDGARAADAARAAVHEDADVLVVATELVPAAKEALAGADADDIVVVAGGEAPVEGVVGWLRSHLPPST